MDVVGLVAKEVEKSIKTDKNEFEYTKSAQQVVICDIFNEPRIKQDGRADGRTHDPTSEPLVEL